MTTRRIWKHTLVGVLFLVGLIPLSVSQNVPMALKYQAVARNNNGEEMKSEIIDVRMSVIAGNPDGVMEWQEIHTGVQTSQFGLFSILLGKGDRSGGIVASFEEIPWSESSHYLKVEIKFDQAFLEMGTSQFLSVPYALYSQTSLTPGPEGPAGPKGDKGDPGDPATDDQTLSFDGENLSIQGGNTINMSGLKQYLSLKGDTLSLTNGNYVTLTDVVEDDDADPDNEIQDLMISDHILRITGNQDANPINLNPYLDNTDNQALSYAPATHQLTLANGGTVDLAGLKNIPLIGFRAGTDTPQEVGTYATVLVNFPELFDHSECYNNGVFTAPADGVYSFYVRYDCQYQQSLVIYLDGNPYEYFYREAASAQYVNFSFLYELNAGQTVSLYLTTKVVGQCGAGAFSGFRVH